MSPIPPADPIVPTPPATTLSYQQSSALMGDQNFKGRVKVACLKFAGSIMIEASTVPAHNTRMRWAANCEQNPELVSQQTQPPTVMDPAVQTAGSAITDLALQGAVEGVINSLM